MLAHFATLPWVNHTKDKIKWGGLIGSALSITLSEAARQHQQLLVVVTENTPSALKLEAELQDLLPEQEVMVFPDWETLPYDHFSAHQDIISQRLATLNQLHHSKKGILIIPVATLMQRTAPPSFIYGNMLMLEKNQAIFKDEDVIAFFTTEAEEDIDFDKEEKVTTIALDEYLEGKISWKKTEESIDQKS